jgi:hypothetical protein
MQDDEPLTNALSEVFAQCETRSMKQPFIICIASPNGSVIALRCVSGSAPEVLAEHNEGDRFPAPLGILVVDQSGKAAKFVVDRRGRPQPEATGRAPAPSGRRPRRRRQK